MTVRAYPTYRESGIDWIGLLPVEWKIQRVLDAVNLINGFPFDSALFDSEKGMPLVRIRDLNQTKTDVCYVGQAVTAAEITDRDLLIGMDGEFTVGRWRGTEVALLNQRVCCLRGQSEIVRWLEYALPTPLKLINDLTYSTTVKHLSSGQVRSIRVPCPPTGSEQTKILQFLDRETGKIDALVAEQERLIALLKEKRQAAISRAVTKGLDPNTLMKDSGVPWLGEVPAHWSVCRVSYHATVENGSTPSRDNQSYWTGDCSIPWITSGEVNQYVVSKPSEFITPLALEESNIRIVPKGSVLVGLVGQGRTRGMAARMAIEGTINQNVAAIIPKTSLISEFLHHSIENAYEHLREYGRGGNQAALNCEILRAFIIPAPPLPEQEQIVELVSKETNELEALKREANRAITILRERRAALISAAVTGKIDVRDTIAQPSSQAA